MFPIHEDEQQTEAMACCGFVHASVETNQCVSRAKTLAETFAGGHPAADLGNVFDTELDEIRQQSRLGSRAVDWGC